MKQLSDDLLLEAYYAALDLQLDQRFIALLLSELHARQLRSN
ncbi:sporulation histidine kinase inhibitor Sda [Amphibacillus jilinensis]|nr:sporulation histidine kinase inhibitor Sda [Amphibacillus jilinensis]